MITINIKATGLPTEASFWNIMWNISPSTEFYTVGNLGRTQIATLSLPGEKAALVNFTFWYEFAGGTFYKDNYTIQDGKIYTADFQQKMFTTIPDWPWWFPWLPWEGPPLPRIFPPWQIGRAHV